MTSQPCYQRGDRIALVGTDDPGTRLRPGDQGTVTGWDPAQGQLHIRWDSGSTLSMLPGEGDQIRLLTPAASEADGTGPEDLDDGEPAEDVRQDITDPATGLSRLLSERCATCILRVVDCTCAITLGDWRGRGSRGPEGTAGARPGQPCASG
jgi:hypothetical protein